MVALLNYLHVIIIVLAAIGIYIFRASPKKMLWTGAIGLVLLMALQALAPSYLPKNAPHRAALAPMESSEAVIEDRLRKPDTLEERDARLEEELDWREQIEDTKAKEETKPATE